MIIVFLILAFLHTLHGVPTAAPATLTVNDLVTRDGLTISPSEDTSTRSMYDLVNSCILTVLACVWTAAHPNIPGPRDSTWTCFKRRVVMMTCALIAPELMALWALRQRIAARNIADDYNAEVLGLPKPERLSLWKNIRNLLKESWFLARDVFFKLLTVCGRRRDDHRLTVAHKDLSRWKHLWHWLRVSFWGGMTEFVHEFFIELPEHRARRGKGQTWTTTHGFFIQMGGFLLYEDCYPRKVLDLDSMKKMIHDKKIDAPIFTEDDLNDRSKGDTISKGVVVLQTTWFIIQCITRLCRGLPLSELEVVTLGFALLNGIIYAVWWNKPQGVGLAIFIALKEGLPTPAPSEELQNANSGTDWTSYGGPTTIKLAGSTTGTAVGVQQNAENHIEKESERSLAREGITTESRADELVIMDDVGFERQSTRTIYADSNDNRGASAYLSSSNHTGRVVQGTVKTTSLKLIRQKNTAEKTTVKESWLRKTLEEDWAGVSTITQWLCFTLVMVPIRSLGFLLRPLWKMLARDSTSFPDGAHRIPMFYADNRGNGLVMSCVIGTAFGAVHLLAWSSSFPSRTELLLWRISTLVIIADPILLMVMGFLDAYENTPLGLVVQYIIIVPAAIAGMILYVVARFALIVLAFLSLSALPPSAFITIPWTSFIPHL